MLHREKAVSCQTVCGHMCLAPHPASEQPPEKGPCNCLKQDCPHSSKFVGVNALQPYLKIRHADLVRKGEGRSFCPVCKDGLLRFITHYPPNASAELTQMVPRINSCLECAQLVWYEESHVDGMAFYSCLPMTLEDTTSALEKMLDDEDRAYLQAAEDREKAAIGLHHSLGRHLRNEWGLWRESPLAVHMKEVHFIEHPDDMSHHIIMNFAYAKFPTRWERVTSEGELP